MSPLVIALLILWFISGIGLVVLILMHSGKGTGVSDMIAASMYSSASGSSIMEKNLDKLTIVFALVFVLCCLAAMIVFPVGSIG
ncbi:MAG: preprotein translocase subunit SecG [Coriobacteriia bacterium]|nr:preprotein translocase subunit SecG [Coriobacteriia bacterium]